MSTANARLDYRVKPEIKKLVQEAARLHGQTESGFAVAALTDVANQVIAKHTITQVSAKDWAEINRLLAADARPNKRLSSAARRYKKRVS